MKNYILYLRDIFKAIESIENFTSGLTFQNFKNDDKTSSAVIRKFEIIGEATKNIPKNVRSKYRKIPWKKMAGMRDKLIHAYFQIDYDLVWSTIQNSLPELKKSIAEILKKENISAENLDNN